MKKPVNIILMLCIAVLAIVSYNSIAAPVQFDNERQLREKKIKKALIRIRTAELRWQKSHNGRFTDSFDSLRSTPTDSLELIPYGGGRKFHLQIGTTQNKGQLVHLFECSASIDDYMSDFDSDQTNEAKAKAADAGSFAGLKIGDLHNISNNAGNWE